MNIEQKVKNMYTEYTYPKYDTFMDKFAPIPHQYTPFLFPEQINYYIYGGKKTTFDNYNILVAGVGLGGDLINMAYLLREYNNVRLTGIDLSPKSLQICKERLEKYNLSNINLIEMSLLDLDPNVHGIFDLIICIGVLHHLENPINGLNSLKKVLAEDGGINIMVYGKYGRTGVYQMQELLKMINKNVDNYTEKISNFKKLYSQLPNNNWFHLGEHLIDDHKVSDEGIVDDHKVSDEGIVDLLLHCQDRAYDIPELYEWVNGCDLNIVDFTPITRFKYKYNIPKLQYPKDIISKYTINELFFGDIIKHSFYVTKNKVNVPLIGDLNNVMCNVLMTTKTVNKMLKYYETNSPEKLIVNTTLQYKFNDGIWSCSNEPTIHIEFKINEIIYIILNNIDSNKSTKIIFQNVRDELKLCITDEKLLKIWKPVYELFNLYDLILLKSS
jgi:SAM-dependent methyltransferase